jgi:hypothetical protein
MGTTAQDAAAIAIREVVSGPSRIWRCPIAALISRVKGISAIAPGGSDLLKLMR